MHQSAKCRAWGVVKNWQNALSIYWVKKKELHSRRVSRPQVGKMPSGNDAAAGPHSMQVGLIGRIVRLKVFFFNTGLRETLGYASWTSSFFFFNTGLRETLGKASWTSFFF